jgi:GT2 family glycosyltransferase
MTLHRVTAILVVHDGATWLPEVVAAIASQKRKVDALIAVDTGSEDSSVKLLKGARIPVLSLDRDAGFGQAVAYAVSTLPELDLEYNKSNDIQEWLWIIHDDLAPHNKALRSLVDALEDRPSVVMAGPKLLGWHDHSHLLEVGISITANGARWTGLEPSEYDQGQRDGIHDVLSVSTAGALIRRDVFEELDGFDPNLELFRDDVDFGWRVRVAGHTVIAVTDAIAYHAEASASERRSVDVQGAFLHRPRLLDRRNAAYVLLANSSWWTLPFLGLQILAGAALRSLGYLFAKLPGYASDEILAIGSLLFRPNEIIEARKFRKKHRLVSPRIVAQFIPPRLSQIRANIERSFEWLRLQVFPDHLADHVSAPKKEIALDDEDLLEPQSKNTWWVLFKRPLFLIFTGLTLTSLAWSRHRFGSLSGGSLPAQLHGASDLWSAYLSGWHNVGMGSTHATPPWIAYIGLASIFTLGNVPLLFTVFFITAPLLIAGSAYSLLRRFTEKRWISALAAALYAISPVAISASNTGRFGVLIVMALLPFIFKWSRNWYSIELAKWRKIFQVSFVLGLAFAFAPQIFVALFGLMAYAAVKDFLFVNRNYKDPLFVVRLIRRVTVLGAVFFMNIPWSLELLVHPHRFFLDAGYAIPGGGPNYAILGNPGGPGALPWWNVSPLFFVLVIALFSVTRARQFAEIGLTFLLVATLFSAVSINGNGNSSSESIYTGTLISIATILAVIAGVIMLDKLREILIETHVNFRHFSAALLLVASAAYGVATIGWVTTQGAVSPVQSGAPEVLPAFLAVERNAKTVVLRVRDKNDFALNFYVARGGDVTLGQPDVAPTENKLVSEAVRNIADGSGLTSGTTLAAHGIKYLFFKSPTNPSIVRTIDGLGGFTRASSTSAGVSWKVVGQAGELVFTPTNGQSQVLVLNEQSGTYSVPSAGVVTLTENFSRGWQLSQSGQRLARSRSALDLPVFSISEPGEVELFYDGTMRRGWSSLQFVVLITVLTLALPAGRRRREISEEELA